MNTSRRTITAIAGAIAVTAVAALNAPTASAAPPKREVLRVQSDATYPSLCSFPLHVQDEGIFIVNTFTDTNGSVVRTTTTIPQYRAVLTNEATGASLEVGAPGPEFVTFHPDGSRTRVGTGPWLWGAFHPTNGEPGLFLIQGRFVIEYDLRGNQTSVTFDGQATNLCKALGG